MCVWKATNHEEETEGEKDFPRILVFKCNKCEQKEGMGSHISWRISLETHKDSNYFLSPTGETRKKICIYSNKWRIEYVCSPIHFYHICEVQLYQAKNPEE